MRKTAMHKGSGNVFRDIGFSAGEAAELSVKSSLIDAISDTIAQRKLTPTGSRKDLQHRPADPLQGSSRTHGKRDDRSSCSVAHRAWSDRGNPRPTV